MKKLMIALSAVASAFALYADATTIAGENFNEKTLETLTGWSGLGDSSISSTAYTQHDANPAAGIPEQDKLALTLPGENLAVKTPLTAPAYLSFTETSMAGVYFDSLVKFTACDEDAAIPENSNAKILVWTKEMTNASGDVTGTNLMVTAGFFGTADALEPKVYDCGSITAYGVLGNGDDWCRLTIKAKNTVATSATVPAFVVFVNGKPATIAGIGDALKIGLDDSLILGALTKVDKIWEGNHQLFPSMVSMNDQISAIGFAGQGAVDDIEVYSGINPTLADGVTPFANDPVPVLATVNGDDCTSIEAVNAAIAAATSGATVELVDDVTGNLTFDNGAANTLNLGAFTLNGGITGGATSTLTINGTGKVEGTLYTDNTDAMVLLNGGQYLASANADIKDMAEAKAGYEIALNGDYYEITEISEDGTVAKPWKIDSATKLAEKAAEIAAGTLDADHQNFKLMNNIDFENAVFAGIGTAAAPFVGTFDGDGKVVSGYKLPAVKTYQGFFMVMDGATIKNVTFAIAGFDTPAAGIEEFGGAAVAGVANGASKFINVTANGTLTGGALPAPNHTLAGLVVQTTGSAVFEDCTNNVNIVNAQNKKTAGFVGTPKQTGTQTLTFTRCVNNGNIDLGAAATGDGGTAAFCGWTSYSAVVFEDCVNNGAISSVNAAQLGSFCGKLYGTIAVTLEGTCTTKALDIPAMGTTALEATEAPAFNFATVNNGVATFPATPAVGGTYKVMLPTATFALALNKDESITFDKTLGGTITITATDAENTYIDETDGTYTCHEKTTPTIVVTLDPAEAEWSDTLTFPTPVVTGADTYDTSWSPAAITEPAAGATNEYVVTISVAATATTKATTGTATFKVWKSAGSQDWPADPTEVAGQTAGDAFGLTGELATADAVKVAQWAKANSVAFGDRAEINVKAMLLNIANDGDVAAAEAAVKFTADDLAALMADPAAATSLATKYPYATVTIGAYADAACTTEWTEGDQKFFKATLTVPQASVE